MQLPDPRNENILIHIGGELLPREDAKISVFDSAVQGGDAVWEGLRVYNGKIFQLDAHLDRLFDSAKALAFADIPSREAIKTAIFETLKANNMRDEVHIRLTLTRGKKTSSGMSPHFNQYGSCLIVLPEWKPPVYSSDGIRLITASVRRNPPMCIDSKIHHNNLINNILAKIEANVAGVDDAIMLDIFGYVSETNATNIFIIKKGTLITPPADSCLPGITRGVVIDLAHDLGIEVTERNLSLTEVYTADESFTTGTMGELSPILEVDGRTIGNGKPGPITNHLREQYAQHTAEHGEPIP
ncbi:MAG: branched-chain-amino-acid transaminase [Gemmatimonadetes bacterium]|nr:branched-chain-amino-acid transaminase [Gemmatimonadota bacterium]MYB57637.1 branched-chain-amino-acid transaminase [Gemmatimonadota bacterium]